MAEAVRRNVSLILGIAVTGMIFALAAPAMRLSTGAPGTGILQAQSPMLALATVIGCGVLALAVACLVGRLVNAVMGLFVLGGGLFVLARRGGSFENLAFADGSLAPLAVELVLWSGLVLGATLVVFRVAGPLKDIEPETSGRRPHWLLSPEAFRSAAAGLLVLPVVWIIAQSSLKGQTIAAVTLGATAAGLVARLVAPHLQPKLIFASVCLFGAIGHTVGMILLNQPLDMAYVHRTASPLNLPMPIDYAAGSLLGVAMGLGWAKSFLHHEQ